MKSPHFRAHRYSLHPYAANREGQRDRIPLHRQSYPSSSDGSVRDLSRPFSERRLKTLVPELTLGEINDTGPSTSFTSTSFSFTSSVSSIGGPVETLSDSLIAGSRSSPLASSSGSLTSETQISKMKEPIHIDFRKLSGPRTPHRSPRALVMREDVSSRGAEQSPVPFSVSANGTDFGQNDGSQSLSSSSSSLHRLSPLPSLYNTPAFSSRDDHPEFVEKKIRGVDGLLRWFKSVGGQSLTSPPSCQAVEVGDLFIHRAGDATQVWLWNKAEEWVQAREGQAHPLLLKHRLRVTADGTPSWVLRKTITNYRGKEKRDKLSQEKRD
ncbi:hypothetical protein DENSPDRAFT_109404 [Dentipellis sp. KUC8613]|nr:hypothetical protein DENSPDRAFT_109404 [Dentipellis sp. KUC8613]